MRIEGVLTKWNDDRGFGFVTAASGGAEIFVHISAFPKDGRRPALGERVSFEVETDSKGKKRAINVLCPNRPVVMARHRAQSSRRSRPSLIGRIVAVLFVALIAVYGYRAYPRYSSVTPAITAVPIDLASSSQFRCDGRIHCSQMKSCTEAKFFLKNCPDVRMDGNHDGVPCEQQWCTSPLAK